MTIFFKSSVVLYSLRLYASFYLPIEGGPKPKTSFGHLGCRKVDRKPKQNERGFIQPSLLSQANVPLHSKHRTGLSWSSEHTSVCQLMVHRRWRHLEFKVKQCVPSAWLSHTFSVFSNLLFGPLKHLNINTHTYTHMWMAHSQSKNDHYKYTAAIKNEVLRFYVTVQKINLEISTDHTLQSNIDLCCMVLFLKS